MTDTVSTQTSPTDTWKSLASVKAEADENRISSHRDILAIIATAILLILYAIYETVRARNFC